jgi:hypothetical protein
MTATVDTQTAGEFIISIQEVKTTVVDTMQDVIKYVSWSIEYVKNGFKDSAGTYTTELFTPVVDNFTAFNNLTQEQLVSWIESTDERLPGIKNYLKHRVDLQLEQSLLESKPLPWVPVVENIPATVEPAVPI